MERSLEMNLKLTTICIIALVLPSLTFANKHEMHGSNIDKAVMDKSRPANERGRDANRKPAEILKLLGVESGMRIADLSSGGGYYTALLSKAVGKNGAVIAHNTPYVVNKFTDSFKAGGPWETRLSSASWKVNVTKMISDLDDFKPAQPVDAALMVMFYHDTVWQKTDRSKMNEDIFNAIKPGGHYLIIDHSAEAGSGGRDTSSFHRIDKKMVIKELTDAGFKLVADSDILSNPEDTRDYNIFRDYKTKRDQTDRFVLKFERP